MQELGLVLAMSRLGGTGVQELGLVLASGDVKSGYVHVHFRKQMG